LVLANDQYSHAERAAARRAPPIRPSRDWIKVKNPDSPAVVRAREGRWLPGEPSAHDRRRSRREANVDRY